MLPDQTSDFYAMLGIPVSASDADIRSAYRHAALRAHPDKGGSVNEFRRVALVFEVLSDPVARDLYDQRRRCKVLRRATLSSALGKKRSRQSNVAGPRSSKRACSTAGPKRKRCRGEKELQQLAAALRSVDAAQRRDVLASLGQHVRKALLTFMTLATSTDNACPAVKSKTPQMRSQLESLATAAAVRTVTNTRITKYQASLQIRDLRLYTPERVELQAAIDDKIILVKVRQAMVAATLSDQNFWDDPLKQQAICEHVLSENNTNDTQLGLRAWVQMRSNRWLGDGCKVGSPVSSLSVALQVHTRLHRANATSWEAFRTEWVQLITLRGKRSRAEAEVFVGARRQAAVKARLARGIRAVERVFGSDATPAATEKRRCEEGSTTGTRRVSMKMAGA